MVTLKDARQQLRASTQELLDATDRDAVIASLQQRNERIMLAVSAVIGNAMEVAEAAGITTYQRP